MTVTDFVSEHGMNPVRYPARGYSRGMAILAMTGHGQDDRATPRWCRAILGPQGLLFTQALKGLAKGGANPRIGALQAPPMPLGYRVRKSLFCVQPFLKIQAGPRVETSTRLTFT